MRHFHSPSSTSREERAKGDHAWKHLFLVPLFEFHDTRHFVEFVSNFKVPYSKWFLKWGSRASCSMPVNSTTPTQLKEDPTKLKEVKEVAKLRRTIVAMPDELASDSFNHNQFLLLVLCKIWWTHGLRAHIVF